MEFGKHISDLKDEDLPRYKDFLLDKILGKQRKESFRSKMLNRVEEVNSEIDRRNGLEQRHTGGR